MRRFTLVLAVITLCVLGMISALRMGQARARINESSLASLNEAAQLSPHDPEVYRARARLLVRNGEFDLAVADLRQALALRPHDFKAWRELARTLDKQGNSNAALDAFARARMLAPYDFMVRWDAAELLQKLGRHEEAFKELRVATSTVPASLDLVMKNAWESYAGNADAVLRAVDPQTTQERFSLLRFFLTRDRPGAALKVAETMTLSADDREQLVTAFTSEKAFAEAYELWSQNREVASGDGFIRDGGFESGGLSDEAGFNWIAADDLGAVELSIDREHAYEGASSLRVDWKGNPKATTEIVSQLILVQPNTKYSLGLATRARNLVTGGGPVVTIVDASDASSKTLKQSDVLPLGHSVWKELKVEFETRAATKAVRIAVTRQECSEGQCPIFGALWLDSFALTPSSR